MRKANLIAATVTLGLMLCSAAFAYTISGVVYSDNAGTHPAPCAFVYLYGNLTCEYEPMDTTTSVAGGEYEFTGLPEGQYSVRAEWCATACALCDTAGSECDVPTQTGCVEAIIVDQDLERDLYLDIDCRCKQDDP